MSTPQERIAAVDQGLRVTRALMAELNTAVTEHARTGPDQRRGGGSFDRDGYLRDLFIEPTALTDYTHAGAGGLDHRGVAR